jgi:hypothetical protein
MRTAPADQPVPRLRAPPPNPRDLSLFSRQNGVLIHAIRGRHRLPPRAFPAAEPVARVASQHCPIPSASGELSMMSSGTANHNFAVNGKLSSSQLSHETVHSTLVRRAETHLGTWFDTTYSRDTSRLRVYGIRPPRTGANSPRAFWAVALASSTWPASWSASARVY